MNKKHLRDICKIGQGKLCCRYLVVGGKGFECSKHTDTKTYIDARVKAKSMNARGDNCKGYPAEESIRVLNNDPAE